MSVYSQEIMNLEQKYLQAKELEEKINKMAQDLDDRRKQYCVFLEAQQLLATVSDANTSIVLDYIMGIINKTLSNLFPHDLRRVELKKTLYQGQYAHINIVLRGSDNQTRDIQLQSGTGLRQVISFLFVLSLIEIRKGRPILIMDEILSGLHPTAKKLIRDIILIFAQDDFQFVMVEYGMDDVGKLYLVEKPNAEATITPYGDDVYRNETFKFNRPPEDVDLDLYVEEGVPDGV